MLNKRVFGFGVALVMTIMVAVFAISGAADAREFTEEELMEAYILEEYGNQCYGKLIEDDEEDAMSFYVYDQDNSLHHYVSVDKGYCETYME